MSMMTGLDFWATDPYTDSVLPIFDEWSVTFCLREWTREVMHDEIMLALQNVPKSKADAGRPGVKG